MQISGKRFLHFWQDMAVGSRNLKYMKTSSCFTVFMYFLRFDGIEPGSEISMTKMSSLCSGARGLVWAITSSSSPQKKLGLERNSIHQYVTAMSVHV